MRLRLIAALTVAVLAGGGYLAQSGGDSKASGGSPPVGVQLAAQPGIGPHASPSGSPAPSGSADANGSPGVNGSPGATGAPTPAGPPKPTKTLKPTPKPTPKPAYPTSPSSMVNTLLAQINALRAQHGLPPYTLLPGLIRSAHAHNLVMAGSCGMQHQCPGEKSLGARITAQGVSWSSCGENIGWSAPHPNTASAMTAAAEGLTTSMYNEKPPDDGHRRNILSTGFHHIGIDVIRTSDGKVWLTQDFSS